MRGWRLLALVVVGLMAVPAAWGWGREGHRLTALVAEAYLSPAAAAAVRELLHGEMLAGVSDWADEYRREHPETAPWHFVDIPSTAARFDRQRDCPVVAGSPWRDCITDRILYFEGRLGDTELPPKERAQALKFLVHLIGDVHQPLHTLADARGGNSIRVTLLGSSQCGAYACNLHGVWDDGLIEAQELSERRYTERLLAEIKENHWERLDGGEPTTWANLSHAYAVKALVPDGAVLGREYVEEESRVVDAQLALGGLRLARVLNRILGATDGVSSIGK